jgi:G:T-mismatch repair DNA endonuclease (very short patch repair protein)
MTNAEKLIQEKYNGIHPICGCGCKEKTVYDYSSKDFGKFKRGHQTRVDPNYFGDPKNPKRVEKIISTRKQKFASGEYDHVKDAIKQNRKDPNLGKKISKGAKGIPKPKPEGFGVGRKHSKKTKEKMSDSAIERILETDQNHTSKLEKEFALILNNLKIKYTQWFYAKDIKAFYDFYIPLKNTIIEVDGDFWHCNPNSKFALPEYKTQEKNLKRDQQKTQWAKDNGFKLLRFWEYDIKNNPQQIIEILKKELT